MVSAALLASVPALPTRLKSTTRVPSRLGSVGRLGPLYGGSPVGALR